MALTIGQRTTAYERTGGRCAYCGCELDENNYHVDHMTPKSLGGKTNKHNLIAACPDCNLFKADSTVEVFRRRIAALVTSTAHGRIIAKYYGVKNEPIKFYFEEIDNGYI